MNDQEKFELTITRFDAENAEDPNHEIFEGQEYPKELLYAKRMTAWQEKLAPEASPIVKLAARAQHIRRWEIPRSSYPMDRKGYRQWRTDLGKFHAKKADEIMRGVGYDEEIIERVQALLRKENLKLDPDVQLLEDIICLVFLESYFADFSEQHDEKKLINIIRRTWKKMSPQGHQAALELELPSELASIIEKALTD
tara:strand:- start:1 stop:591 length:591 start_codon:yes stop_codon:yes gene_type:complete